MMTKRQFRRLPGLMQEIVLADRQLGRMRRASVVVAAEFRDKRETRQRLRQAATAKWGYRLGGDEARAG